MKFLVLSGPNINMLGVREPGIYGSDSYDDLVRACEEKGKELGVETEIYQSNHEGDLIDKIQEAYGKVDGIIFNPGGYTHTSVALRDAISAVKIDTVEVHISDVSAREDFRQISYIRDVCVKTISGRGISGYTEAIEFLYNRKKGE